jgi:DNA-binding NtrC family response regulator
MAGIPAVSAGRILVVEDEDAQRTLIAEIVRRRGHVVAESASADEALEAVDTEIPDLVLSDWRLPGGCGGDLLDELRRRGIGCAFVVMTAYGSIAHAVEAMQRGADDYLAKPFDRDALLLTIERALRTRRLLEENLRLRRSVAAFTGLAEMRGRAAAMQRLFGTIEKVAATDATVLITGESGTGKELVARTLHDHSHRRSGPFVAVNCAAIPGTLLESELFGHEKGAFTGADRRREGLFEAASSGTLFLDEIASMPPALQPALLRVLQERRFTRVGGRGEVDCDVRIVAASNRDLGAMVASGTFRDDLYYRLNVMPLRIPPLRERREDIPLLAEELLGRAARRHSLPARPLPPAVLRRLMAYAWPGNVRELANAMERLALLAENGVVRETDLPDEILAPPRPAVAPFLLPPDGVVWEELEASLVRQALERAGGNRTMAARLLGLSYKAFLYRLDKLAHES